MARFRKITDKGFNGDKEQRPRYCPPPSLPQYCDNPKCPKEVGGAGALWCYSLNNSFHIQEVTGIDKDSTTFFCSVRCCEDVLKAAHKKKIQGHNNQMPTKAQARYKARKSSEGV